MIHLLLELRIRKSLTLVFTYYAFHLQFTYILFPKDFFFCFPLLHGICFNLRILLNIFHFLSIITFSTYTLIFLYFSSFYIYCDLTLPLTSKQVNILSLWSAQSFFPGFHCFYVLIMLF